MHGHSSKGTEGWEGTRYEGDVNYPTESAKERFADGLFNAAVSRHSDMAVEQDLYDAIQAFADKHSMSFNQALELIGSFGQ